MWGLRSIFRRAPTLEISKTLALFFASLLLTGCGSLKYLLQAGQGQLALINHARPIADVLHDERTPPRIKGILNEIREIKKYGEGHGLKPTSNYTEYVNLNRNAAVWVVSACRPLKFEAKEWSFPVVGSFPYLGWFDPGNAKEYADELKKEGWDVDVRGASAYSTLGWFRDAVLSTMIPDVQESLGDLINVILHESVHSTLYIEGQSYFNESLAQFVAAQMTPDYFDKSNRQESPEKKAYIRLEESRKSAYLKFHQAFKRLSEIYSSSRTDQQKLEEKENVLTQLKAELSLSRTINNATLIQYQTYHSGHEDFRKVFLACGSSWPRFFAAVGKLKKESFHRSQETELGTLLGDLANTGCP